MKSFGIKSLSLFGLLILTSRSQAHSHSDSQVLSGCLVKDIVRISRDVIEVEKCQRVNAELKSKDFWYWNFRGNPYHVQYWVGGYERRILMRDGYLVEITNLCTGEGSSRQIVYRNVSGFKQFSLFNPNLNHELQHSYEMSPLGEAEIPRAMMEAYNRCKAYDTSLGL